MTPRVWEAMTDPPDLDDALRDWLSDEVKKAVAAYVKDGFLCVGDDMMVRFHAADPLDDLTVEEPLGELLRVWCLEGSRCLDGTIPSGEDRELVLRFRAILADVVAEMDAVLALGGDDPDERLNDAAIQFAIGGAEHRHEGNPGGRHPRLHAGGMPPR